MIIPVRCFSCGKPIAHLWEEFEKAKKENKDLNKVLNDMGIDRYCCRQVLLGHMELIKYISRYRK